MAVEGRAAASPRRRLAPERLGWGWLLGIVLAIQALVFVPWALLRDLDADEGYYALAAQLVVQGHTAYHDFFWPQMPAFPYVYGLWTTVAGQSFYAMRALSVLIAMGGGLLIYRYAVKRFASPGLGLGAVALYAFSPLVYQWLVTGKAYTLATVLTLGAVLAVDAAREPSRRAWLVAGLLLGLAIDVRLLFAAAVPFVALYAVRPPGGGWRWGAELGRLAAGLALGVLPSAVLLLIDPDRFMFHNLGFHLVQNGHGFFDGVGANLSDKARLVAELLAHQPQFVILLTASLAALVAALRTGRRPPLALGVALGLSIAALSPEPVYIQDFSTVVPFLVLGTIELVALVRDRLGASADPQLARILRATALVALVLFLVAPVVDVSKERRGGFLAGRGLLGDTLDIGAIEDVTAAIDANTAPGDTVLSFWPGYLFGSHANQLPGFENDYTVRGVEFAGLSESEAKRQKLATVASLERAITSHRVPLVVLSPIGDSSPRNDWKGVVERSGYRPIGTYGLTTIYRR